MRISPATVTIGFFALIAALIAAWGVRTWLDRPVETKAEVVPPPDVIYPFAAQSLKKGKMITLGDIAIRRLPPDSKLLQWENVGDAPMTNTTQIVGRILREDIKLGDPFLTRKMYPEGTGPSIAERLLPGFRAVTIPVDNSGLLNGYAGQGTVVDVMFRARASENPRRRLIVPEVTVALVEGVEVLNVTAPSGRQQNSVGTVTLAVSPEQAKILQVVQGRGDLSLAMRSNGEPPVSGTSRQRAITLEDLLGIQPLPGPWFTEIYRRTGRQVLGFDRGKVIAETFGGTQPKTGQPFVMPGPANGNGSNGNGAGADDGEEQVEEELETSGAADRG